MTLTRRNCNESDIENGMGDLMFLSDNGFTYTADAQYNAGLRFNICRFGAEYVTDLSDFDYMEYELEDYIDQNGRKLESSPQLWGEASDGSPGNMYRDKAEAYEPMIAGIPGSIINITEDGADRIVRTPMKLLNYEGYFNAARYATVSLNNEYGNRGTVTHIRFIKNEAPDYVSKDVPQNLTLKTPNDRVKEGATSFLIPVITNKNGIPVYDGIEYEWFSSDPSIATVDEDGIITGINANATPAVITVKLKGTEISSSISITVYKDMPPAGIRLSQANNFRTCTVEELKRGIVLNPQAIDSNGFPMPKITCENPVVTVEEAGGTGATASEADADGYITLQSDTAKAGTIELKLVTSDAFAAEPAILVMDIIDGYRVPIYNAYNASQNAAETIFDTSGYQASLNVTSSAAYNNGIGFIVDLSGISDDNPDLTIADIGGVYANAATSGGWLQMFTPNDLNGAGNWTAPIIACTDAALQSGNNWTNAAPVSGQIDVIDGIYRADFDFSGEKSVSGNTPPSDLTGSYFNFAFGVDGINTMTIADVILIPKAAE